LSQSHSVIIGSSWGTFTGEIKNDGSFLVTGKGVKPGEALIYTDSSGADALWLEPGEYDMECREIHMEGSSGIFFRTSRLEGPKDAALYYGFSQPFYYLNAATAEKRKEIRSGFAIKYIDSAFKHCPSSKVLPELLRRAGSLLEDEVVKMYFSLLSEEQLAQPGAEQLVNYYKRKDKIAVEKTFANFSLPTDKDGVFDLNSIKNKKLILIDFWSSDCAPCRRKHQRLVELYKNYSTKGLEIVSISLDTDKKEWIEAIKNDKMNWINVSELKGWNTTIAENYFIKSIPFGFWINGDRKIISTENLSDSEIEKNLEQ
jgi:thiol-disulfide isomerase/thioredoxin